MLAIWLSSDRRSESTYDSALRIIQSCQLLPETPALFLIFSFHQSWMVEDVPPVWVIPVMPV